MKETNKRERSSQKSQTNQTERTEKSSTRKSERSQKNQRSQGFEDCDRQLRASFNEEKRGGKRWETNDLLPLFYVLC